VTTVDPDINEPPGEGVDELIPEEIAGELMAEDTGDRGVSVSEIFPDNELERVVFDSKLLWGVGEVLGSDAPDCKVISPGSDDEAGSSWRGICDGLTRGRQIRTACVLTENFGGIDGAQELLRADIQGWIITLRIWRIYSMPRCFQPSRILDVT
jgi:hypothetical protein